MAPKKQSQNDQNALQNPPRRSPRLATLSSSEPPKTAKPNTKPHPASEPEETKGSKKLKHVTISEPEVVDKKTNPKAESEPVVVNDKAKGSKKLKRVTISEPDKKTTIIVEHCKQCSSFKTRALQVKNGLEEAVEGVNVVVNPEKPRKGCFEIREENGESFVSLLGMKRPFKKMKELDMAKLISHIVENIK